MKRVFRDQPRSDKACVGESVLCKRERERWGRGEDEGGRDGREGMEGEKSTKEREGVRGSAREREREIIIALRNISDRPIEH